MNEIWKPCPRHEGLYEVSDLGRVKRLAQKILQSNGIVLKYPTRVFRTSNTNTYKLVKLSGVAHPTHRLVAEAFIPNPESKPLVNHKNGVKNDNKASNLEWATHAENTNHAFRTGLMSIGPGKKKHVTLSKKYEGMPEKVAALILKNKTRLDIALMLGISQYTVKHIVRTQLFSLE